MPFDGAGLFQRLYNWVNDKNNNINITSSRMDEEDDGFAAALSNCVTKDGQTQPTADLPMNGNKHTNVENADSRNQYAVVGQIQDGSYVWGSSAGGTANAITIAPTPAITAYAAGQRFQFLATATNTGAATIAVNGISGPKDIYKGSGLALVAGDIVNGQLVDVQYDGTRFRLLNAPTYAHGADIASAGTINLDTATGDLVDVTGATTITAITLSEGRECTTRFTGAPQITHGASLVLPGAANFQAAAGDFITWRGYASGVVRAISVLKASGASAVAPVNRMILAFRMDSGTTLSASATNYMSCSGHESAEGNAQIIIPFPCTARNLNAIAGGSPGGATNFTYTLRKNSGSTVLTAAINGGNTTAADSSHTVSLAAGDKVCMQVTADPGTNTVGGAAATIELFW